MFGYRTTCVSAVPPIILDPPVVDFRAAEGQTINLTCNVLGIPQPLVVWLKGQEQLTGGHYTVMPEGHLQISVRRQGRGQ
jgi:neuronal cell adhesion protein